jgi:hypothetical protein
MPAFTALDIREVAHQLNESHSGLAALAATVALLHLLAGAGAFLILVLVCRTAAAGIPCASGTDQPANWSGRRPRRRRLPACARTPGRLPLPSHPGVTGCGRGWPDSAITGPKRHPAR